MSGFSSKNVRYPRYQDTDLLQLWGPIEMTAYCDFWVTVPNWTNHGFLKKCDTLTYSLTHRTSYIINRFILKEKIPHNIVELRGHLSCIKYPLGSGGRFKQPRENLN